MTAPLTRTQIAKALETVAASEDPDKMRRLMANADRLACEEVRDAAFRRLVDLLPEAALGPVALDFWKSIHATEELRAREAGKTVRLSRTRQKIKRVGEAATVADLARAASASEGFATLMHWNLPELTAEAVVLRHRASFEADVVASAETRLREAGVDLDALPAA